MYEQYPDEFYRLIDRCVDMGLGASRHEAAEAVKRALARDSAVERRMSENLRRRRAGLPIDLTVTTTLRSPHAHRDPRLPLPGTGHLDGFNFQWAWASGFAAGQ